MASSQARNSLIALGIALFTAGILLITGVIGPADVLARVFGAVAMAGAAAFDAVLWLTRPMPLPEIPPLPMRDAMRWRPDIDDPGH